MSVQPAPPRPRVTNRTEAEALIVSALDALDALAPLVETETREMQAGRMRQALESAPAKDEAARRYAELVALLKSNVIAIGRFAPDAIELLKRKHQEFSERLQVNAAVLSTARAVSEQIIREVSAESSGAHNPQGYGARGQAASAYQSRVSPLSVSKTL